MGTEAAVFAFKWNGEPREVALEGLASLGELKARLFTLFDVQVKNQKLIGLKRLDGICST